MKKMLPLLVVGVLVLSGLGAVAGTESEKEEFISETILFSQPIICDKEDYVSIELAESTGTIMQTDKPMLPVITKVYTLPFGTLIDKVDVAFSNPIIQGLSKPITPGPETLPVSINADHRVEVSKEIITYQDIDIYPEKQFSYRVATGLDNGKHVTYLAVSLNPVQYNPKESIITYSHNALIDIEYTTPKNPFNFPDDYDFLILAPAEFESALQVLVDHKNNLVPPVKTTLVTLDEIPSGVGVDEQEDIKYFIKDAIETMGITNVLLVGAGVTDEELFPVRLAWIGDQIEDNFPSDLYYADIYNDTGGFSNWDRDGDGKYAEYSYDFTNVDVIPDVYLGRFPCNNVDEVNIIVDKLIEYKAHNKMTKRILQAGGDTFPGDSQMEGEYANEKVMEKLPGYSTTRLWGTTETLTKPNIADGWKKSVDFVDFSGHGSPASWATHPPNEEHTWIPPGHWLSDHPYWLYADFDIYRVTNFYKYPVVFYNSCSNNKFTKTATCLGWYTLAKPRGGGIATVAASGIGYGMPGDEVGRRMGWMEVHFFDELYNTKLLGEVWYNCIKDYYTTFEGHFDGIDYKTMLELEMFGDPTLVIEDGDDPKSVPVYTPVLPRLLERLVDTFPRLAKLFKLILEMLV